MQKFLINAQIEFLTIVQTSIQVCQVEDPVKRFPELSLVDK